MSVTEKTWDVVTIGAGPTALAAAIYTTREDLSTVCFEKGVIGGLASITDWVDNYPGFPEGISGLQLGENLQKQAERFGTQIELGEVNTIKQAANIIELDTTSGLVKAKTVLIATGSDYRKLGIPGEAEYFARGVHYCATCDGAFYREKRLVVVGGGNSAIQEAIFLTRYASKIDVLVRGDKLRASEVLQHDLKNILTRSKFISTPLQTKLLPKITKSLLCMDLKMANKNALTQTAYLSLSVCCQTPLF